MSMMDDMPKLMNERYNLIMRRERWRGIGDGSSLCNAVTVAANLVVMTAGLTPMSGWLYLCCPAVSVFALWRHHRACARINAMDASMSEIVKAVTPAAAPKEKMAN